MSSHTVEEQKKSKDVIAVHVEDRIAQVMIDRPERRNALSGEVVEELIASFVALGKREDVGVIVLTGAGEKVFCAGGDLGDQNM